MLRNDKTFAAIFAAALAAAACHAKPQLQSNRAVLQIGDEGTIRNRAGQLFDGDLVLRDDEVAAFAAPRWLGGLQVPADATKDLAVAMRIPVRKGRLQGQAVFYVDTSQGKSAKALGDKLGASLAALSQGWVRAGSVSFLDGAPDGKAEINLADVRVTAEFDHGRLHGEMVASRGVEKHKMLLQRGEAIEVTRYFTNGMVREQVRVDESWRKGFYQSGARRFVDERQGGQRKKTGWFPDGKLAYEQVEENGEPVNCREFYSNGKPKRLACDGAFLEPDGDVNTYFESGAIEKHCVWALGVPQTCETYWANGNVHLKEEFADGVPNGVRATYYPDGKRWQVSHYQRGEQHGTEERWYKNGVRALLATYQNGALIGDYARWYASGKPWETAHYLPGGALDGLYTKYWRNGKVAERAEYRAGVRHGQFERNYFDGSKHERGHYQNGARWETIRKWYKNGQLAYLREYKDGLAHGAWQEFTFAGKPLVAATSENGRLNGRLQQWDKSGVLLRDVVYQDGQPSASQSSE